MYPQHFFLFKHSSYTHINTTHHHVYIDAIFRSSSLNIVKSNIPHILCKMPTLGKYYVTFSKFSQGFSYHTKHFTYMMGLWSEYIVFILVHTVTQTFNNNSKKTGPSLDSLETFARLGGILFKLFFVSLFQWKNVELLCEQLNYWKYILVCKWWTEGGILNLL